MSKSRIGLGVGFTIIGAALATPDSAPAALRYMEVALIVAMLAALAVAFVVAKVRQRREDLWLVAPLPPDDNAVAFPFWEGGAANEDGCSSCDPEQVSATHFVEAWDERPGEERRLGEWFLCGPHANEMVTNVRSTGAHAVATDCSDELLQAGGEPL